MLEKKKKEAEELLNKEKLLKQVSNILELGKTQVCAVYCTNWDALCSTTAVQLSLTAAAVFTPSHNCLCHTFGKVGFATS